MIAYFVYIVVALILLFVVYITVKAVTRGIDAKNKNKFEEQKFNQENNLHNNKKVLPMNCLG